MRVRVGQPWALASPPTGGYLLTACIATGPGCMVELLDPKTAVECGGVAQDGYHHRATGPHGLIGLHQEKAMQFTLEVEQEADGRWLAEVVQLPGALAYGASQEQAMAKAEALALRALAEQLEHGEARPLDINIVLPAAA